MRFNKLRPIVCILTRDHRQQHADPQSVMAGSLRSEKVSSKIDAYTTSTTCRLIPTPDSSAYALYEADMMSFFDGSGCNRLSYPASGVLSGY